MKEEYRKKSGVPLFTYMLGMSHDPIIHKTKRVFHKIHLTYVLLFRNFQLLL